MTYDGEIRLKAVVDKSGVVDLEADLGEVEKKAGDAEKAVQDIKLDDSTEKSAKRAAGGGAGRDLYSIGSGCLDKRAGGDRTAAIRRTRHCRRSAQGNNTGVICSG